MEGIELHLADVYVADGMPTRWGRLPASIVKRLAALGVILLTVHSSACEVADPLSLLNGCVGAAVHSLDPEHPSTTTRCDLGREVWLFAIPGRPVLTEELQGAGVPADSVKTLQESHIQGARWCSITRADPSAVERTPSSGDGLVPLGVITCTENRLLFDDVMVVSSRRVTLRLASGPRGVQLAGMSK